MTSPSKKILVYHHRYPEYIRGGWTPLEGLDKHGLGVTIEGELDLWLHHHAYHQSTVKRLHNRTSNIYQVDLLTSDQVKEVSSKVNYEQDVASVKLSLMEWHIKRYRELHIISQNTDKPMAIEVEIKPENTSKAEETVTSDK